MEVQQKKTNNPRSNLASKYHSDEEARFKLALTRALYPNLKEREKNGSDLINASELNGHNNVSQHLQLPPKKNSLNLVSSQKVHSVPRTRMNRNNETLASRNQLQKNIPPRPLISNCLKSKESINIDTVENIVDQFFSVPENNISLETQASNCSQTTRFKEMSTQTSFNESFISVSTLRNVVPPSRQIGSISSAQSSQNGDLNSDFSLVCQDNTMRHCFAKNTPKMSLERQLLAKRRHILDVLSQDVTLLPDGRKMYNNISKIGTDEWLRFALYYVSNEAIINKREKMVDIVETGNTFDMYVDYRTQIQLKRYNDKETKVYKLTKIRALNCGIFKNDDTAGSTEIITTEASKSQLQLSINEICKNQSLRCDDYDPRELDKSKIRIKIHSIFAKMYEVFENNQIPNILYGRQHNFKDCVFENERLKRGQFSKKINMKYKNSRSLFCRIVYVLGKIYVLLQTNKKLTKRELFYQIKHIIVRQSLVDRAIDEVSRLLGLGPWNLNIITHSGLVYGNLQLVWASGEKTNCNLPATLIPYDLDNLVEVQSTAAFILVVEKESIFHKLLEEDLPNKLARPFIMITGKGVPDNTTRLFLNRISRIMAVPVFIIADADVYGIKIMLTYRFGSFANCHLSDDLAVPHARWMGVFPNEIKKYAMKNQPITKRDKNQIQSVLKYPYLKHYPKIVAELEFLLSCNMKASIEGLLKSNTFLSESYLPMKFLNQDFI
ncbi:hypothetical protein Zmor_020077 [Zophobas morio]|uniref:DNA topoisomerase (ATP-hydrolyzing) n=1 Tax=Zophobas morio TaxID=2755281 RepID=A0AA38M9Z6_9CUCU|nr:hypothetical protein Zmor_020077 [Zophobas morio]